MPAKTKPLAAPGSTKTAIKKILPAPKLPSKPPSPQPATTTKADAILALLRRPKGASIADISTATGWQDHSVRGFLSGTVKKKMGLALLVEKTDGATRYRLMKGS